MWCSVVHCVVCVLMYVRTFDVYVYHHHSLLYSGCTLVLQYNLITQHIHIVYMHMYKGDLWNVANICGLAIFIYMYI